MRISLIHFPSHTSRARLSVHFISSSYRVEIKLVFFPLVSLIVQKKVERMDKNKSIVVVGLILINSCSFALIVVLLLL